MTRSKPAVAPRVPGGLTARPGEAATLLVVAVVVCWQLLWRGFTGMANNGDWSRMIAQVGLAVRPADQGTYAARLTRSFVFRPTATDWHQYPTSAGPLVRAVVMLDRQLGAGSFDLASLGLVYLVIYLIGAYGLLRVSRALPAPARAAAVCAGGLLVTDYAFTAYFHSLYSEPVAILGTLFAITAGVHYAAGPGNRRWLAALAVALGVTASAKAQYAPTAVVVALAVAASGALAAKRDRRWCSAAAPLLAGLLVTGVAATELALQPQRIARSNAWDVTYDQVLPFSSHPRSALSELGLSPALVVYSGRSAYAPRTPLTDPVLRVRFPVYVPTTGALTAYWARHPLQSAHLLLRGGAGLSEWRPQYISNTTTPGPGGRRRLLAGASAWSGSVRTLGNAAPGVVALVLLAGLVGPLAGLRRSSRRSGRHSTSGTPATGRGMLPVLSVLSLAAVSQFVTVLLGDGTYELVQHLLLFDLLWGATAVGLLTWGAVRLSASCGRRSRLDR